MDDPRTSPIARARRKLEELRTGAVVPQPAGSFHGRIVFGIVLLIIAANAILLGIVVLLGALARGGPDDVIMGIMVSAIFCGLGVAAGVYGLYLALVSRANTPESAVLLFFASVGGGSFDMARAIVVPNDFDDLPRAYPLDPALGRGGGYAIGSPDDFRSYWSGLLRNRFAPSCGVRLERPRVEELAPGLASVECDLTLTMNTRFWFLLLLLVFTGSPKIGAGGFVALLIGRALTRVRTTVPIRKLLWRAGDEWHLFSGEWQGPEEQDVSWLAGR